MKGKISSIFVAFKLLAIKKGNETSSLLSAKHFLAFFIIMSSITSLTSVS